MSSHTNDNYKTKNPLTHHLRKLVYANAVVLAILFTFGFTRIRWWVRSYEYAPWVVPFFLGLFVGLLGEICAIIWIHRKIRLETPPSPSRYDLPPSTNLRAPIGRMDTPPRNPPQSYSALNPYSYYGRMDTPPKSMPQSYSALNPNAYQGRMDTPTALKISTFCPKCGQSFSPFVQKILSQQKTCFCENCGGPLSSHWQ